MRAHPVFGGLARWHRLLGPQGGFSTCADRLAQPKLNATMFAHYAEFLRKSRPEVPKGSRWEAAKPLAGGAPGRGPKGRKGVGRGRIAPGGGALNKQAPAGRQNDAIGRTRQSLNAPVGPQGLPGQTVQTFLYAPWKGCATKLGFPVHPQNPDAPAR